MRGVTHTLLGAAVALPIAVSRDPAVAAGCIWFGMVGGGLPDWLDLRSDFKTSLRLRHRGASHSIFALAIFVGLFSAGLSTLRQAEFRVGDVSIAPADATIWAWTVSIALGVTSHLLSDACTISGVRPLLPLADARFWLLPKALRGRSDGYLDTVFRALAITALAFGVVVLAVRLAPL
jgi:membrane-bound metal-dependent hydrolase YbcI (DUF457 family)